MQDAYNGTSACRYFHTRVQNLEVIVPPSPIVRGVSALSAKRSSRSVALATMALLFLTSRLPSVSCFLAQMSRAASLHGIPGPGNTQPESLTHSVRALTTLLRWSVDDAQRQNPNSRTLFWSASRCHRLLSGSCGDDHCSHGPSIALGFPGSARGLATDSASAARRLREAKKRWDKKKERELQARQGGGDTTSVETSAVTPLETPPSDAQVRPGSRIDRNGKPFVHRWLQLANPRHSLVALGCSSNWGQWFIKDSGDANMADCCVFTFWTCTDCSPI